jgi:NhaP-type Na+/H+ or K+/H+ antiporter
VIVLLGCGIVLGPVLHWIHATQFPQAVRGVGTLALILILFSAGLELDLRRSRKQFLTGTVLGIISYGLTLFGVRLFCMDVLGMQNMPALLVASSFACMSGSIVLPILEQLNLRYDLKTTLVIEASLGDGIGTLMVGTSIGLLNGDPATSGTAIWGGMAAMFVVRFLMGFVIAAVAGFLWAKFLPRVSNKQFWQALTFAILLLVYSFTYTVGGSELFAVMVFGATLASLLGPQHFLQGFGFEAASTNQSSQIHSFHSEMAFLVRSFFFVLLGAMIQFNGLSDQILPSIGIVAVFVAARWVALSSSRIVWRGTSPRERELALMLMPRGLITAVLALEVIQAMPVELEFLPSLTFAVILLTNVLVLIASVRARALSIAPVENAMAGAPQAF